MNVTVEVCFACKGKLKWLQWNAFCAFCCILNAQTVSCLSFSVVSKKVAYFFYAQAVGNWQF